MPAFSPLRDHLLGGSALMQELRDRATEAAHSESPVLIEGERGTGRERVARVLHHLARLLPEPQHTVLLAGFQTAGTRGEALASGAESVKIHGQYVPVRAEIVKLDGLSAHADRRELLEWLSTFPRAPRSTYVVHGEPAPADAMRRAIADRFGWRAVVPRYGMVVELR